MENIIENNRLIAEFMGVQPNNGGEYEMYGVIECINDGLRNKHFFFSKEMQFHTSWDWLMPVVEKIERMGCIVEISLCLGRTCRIRKIISKSQDWQATHESNSAIEAVYIPVVEFIKWYNTTKP